ncbi:hypothetical protein D3C79_973480 [compost metagenome]
MKRAAIRAGGEEVLPFRQRELKHVLGLFAPVPFLRKALGPDTDKALRIITNHPNNEQSLARYPVAARLIVRPLYVPVVKILIFSFVCGCVDRNGARMDERICCT